MNKKFLVSTVFLCLSFVLSAQQGFFVVKKEDVEEFKELPIYVADARITGGYEGISRNFRNKNFSPAGNSLSSYGRQRVWMDYRSEVHRNLSVNLSLSNSLYLFGDGHDGYYSFSEKEMKSKASNSVVFEQGFLEYNYIPTVKVRAGKQKLLVGDRKALIYTGKNVALMTDGDVGTWRYSAGGATWGEVQSAQIFWYQLTYPVYDTGVQIYDLWKRQNVPQERLEIELYRVFYLGDNSPLGQNGNITWYDPLSNNPEHVLKDGKPVFYRGSMEFWGVNMLWLYGSLQFDLNYAQQNGKRKYSSGSTLSDASKFAEHTATGSALLLNLDYEVSSGHKLSFEVLSASGNTPRDLSADANKYWDNDTEAFYSLSKGAYGDASIYFDGLGGGLAHGISNLTYWGLGYSYRSTKSDLGFDANYYNFKRTEKVYNEIGKKVSNIGQELDLGLIWYLEKTLSFESILGIFVPEEAYAHKDNDLPLDENIGNIFSLSFGLKYHF